MFLLPMILKMNLIRNKNLNNKNIKSLKNLNLDIDLTIERKEEHRKYRNKSSFRSSMMFI